MGFLEGVQPNHLFDRVPPLLQNLCFSAKNGVWIFCYINASCLDRHEKIVSLLQKCIKVLSQYSCLVRLCDVAVNGIHFGDETSIPTGKPCVLEDRYRIEPVLRYVIDQVSKGSLGKFHAEYLPRFSYDVAYMADSCPARSSQVKDLRLLRERDFAQTLQNRSCKFTPERVPDPILFIASFDDFLAVNGLSRCQAAGT